MQIFWSRRGGYPKNHHATRKRDNYLELYGILPTLHVLLERFALPSAACLNDLDLSRSIAQCSRSTDDEAAHSRTDNPVPCAVRAEDVGRQCVTTSLFWIWRSLYIAKDRLARYRRMAPEYNRCGSATTTQCEGYLEASRYLRGGLDGPLTQFGGVRRRHRISVGLSRLDPFVLRRSQWKRARVCVLG